MRSSDVDLLIIPGWGGSGPDHWQSRWEAKLSTARRVMQPDWDKPDREVWAANIAAAVAGATRPVVLIGHSAGNASIGHAASRFAPGKVAGAFLVAPASTRAMHGVAAIPADFCRHELAELPFRSLVIGSSNDPFCTVDEAQELSGHWGADFVLAGDVGHINTESGHGPWPEGSMRLAGFLRSLG
jgi:uncharacterized protein